VVLLAYVHGHVRESHSSRLVYDFFHKLIGKAAREIVVNQDLVECIFNDGAAPHPDAWHENRAKHSTPSQ
jgi:hypothetical protein